MKDTRKTGLVRATAIRFGPKAGQAVILALLGLSFCLLAALGLAVDGANLYAHWQMAQSAADAAAEAAILSVFHGTNVTAANPFATAAPPISSFQCTTTDGRTPCAYALLNGFGGTAADTVTVGFPTSLPGVTTLANNPVPAVSIAIQRNVSTLLLKILGTSSSNIKVYATAALLESAVTNCITVLDPTANNALSTTGNVNINITNCGIGVDSNSSSAMAVTGNVTIQASAIQVVGDVSSSGNVSINPTPQTHLPANSISDPLASVPAPSFNATSTCTSSNLSYNGNSTASLSQGTYCNGISISGNSQVTFAAGNYIFRGGISITGNATVSFGAGTYVLQGGGMTASGNVNMTGAGVTLYDTFSATSAFAPISITGNFTSNLSAPTSGSLEGMLFFEDRNAPSGFTDSFTGNSNQTLTGALYFPRSTLAYTGNSSSSSQNVVLVADKLSLTGNASITYDPTAAAAAHQLSVALVQ